MKCFSGNITRRKPNFAVKDVLVDTKYSVIAENLPLCPILFLRQDLGPLLLFSNIEMGNGGARSCFCTFLLVFLRIFQHNLSKVVGRQTFLIANVVYKSTTCFFFLLLLYCFASALLQMVDKLILKAETLLSGRIIARVIAYLVSSRVIIHQRRFSLSEKKKAVNIIMTRAHVKTKNFHWYFPTNIPENNNSYPMSSPNVPLTIFALNVEV